MPDEIPEVVGLRAVLQLKEIDFCRLRVELWRERWEHAGHQMEHCKEQLARAEEISRTGKEA